MSAECQAEHGAVPVRSAHPQVENTFMPLDIFRFYVRVSYDIIRFAHSAVVRSVKRNMEAYSSTRVVIYPALYVSYCCSSWAGIYFT